MYTMDGVLISEPSGATEGDGGYWVDAFVWVPKDGETEAPPYPPYRMITQNANVKSCP